MKTKILELINNYWKFDNDQQPMSSWHDKQDLIKEIEKLPFNNKFLLKYSDDRIENEKILYAEVFAKDICEAVDIFWKRHDVSECHLIDDDLDEININGEKKIVNSSLYGEFKNKNFEPNMIKEFKDEYAWLSNFYLCKIIINGLQYPSVEHAFQAQKSNDPNWKIYCRETINPDKLKIVSKKIDLIENWNNIRESIMFECLKQKFNQEPFKTKLIATKNMRIQEGNTWGDKFWVVDLNTGKGENRLGLMIEKIRIELLKQQK